MLFGLFFLFPETALKSTTSGFSTGTAQVVLQHKGPQSPIEQAAKAWVSGCQYTSVSHQSQYINLDRAIVFINYTFPDALHIIYCSSFCLYVFLRFVCMSWLDIIDSDSFRRFLAQRLVSHRRSNCVCGFPRHWLLRHVAGTHWASWPRMQTCNEIHLFLFSWWHC